MNTDKTIKILMVDDDPFVLDAGVALLEACGYSVVSRDNAGDAMTVLQKENIDVVVTDIRMPLVSGIELLEKIRSFNPDLPVILMTGYAELEVALNAIKHGAFDFIIKPYSPEYLLQVIEKAARYVRLLRLERNYKNMLEETVRERTRELEDALKTIKKMSWEVVSRLTVVAEYRDTDTGSHIKRIGLYTSKIAEAMSLPEDFTELLRFASSMHDIGKIGIPDSILLKPGSLLPEEIDIMKRHTIIGEKMLSDSVQPSIKIAASIAACHHEKWDGTGYPRGLKGADIPLAGRITMIVDQYDALRSKRPYKKPLEHAEVFRIITEGDGRTIPEHFDPEVLNAFVRVADDLDKIFNKLQE